MKNNIFDIARFGMVISKDIKSFRSRFAFVMIFLAAIDLVVFLTVSLSSSTYQIQPLVRLCIITYCSIIAATLAPSTIYGRINGGNKGIYYAMLPASKLEKFLSMMIVCLLLPPPLFFSAFGYSRHLADAASLWLLRSRFVESAYYYPLR